MDTATAISPADAYEVVARLTAPDMRARSAHGLDNILKERRHGAIGELAKALGVSRSTIVNWRSGDWPPNPDQVRLVCIAYVAAPDGAKVAAVDPATVDLDSDRQAEVSELFNRFYSDNHRDAVTWLIEHRPENFAWNIVDQTPLVA